MRRVVCFAGWPGRVGGAGTESFSTMQFLRARGVEVHCFPTWDAPEESRLREVEALGVTVHYPKPHEVGNLLRELGGPPVVAFCNTKFLPAFNRTRGVSPVIWFNCMTYITAEERSAWKKHGLPEALVFQSHYQRETEEPVLKQLGYRGSIGHLIRGAFWCPAWPFAPLARQPNAPFVVGRTARAKPGKWSSQTLKCLDEVPNVQAILLGVDEAVRRNIERRRWANMLPAGGMDTRLFYGRLHAMIAMNGSDRENWPRVGLEAMAQGVPLVVDAKWGWREMIRHGETGFLAGHPHEFTRYFCELERDEALRLRIARQARASLERDLANPDTLWRGWCEVFRSVGASRLCEAAVAPDFGEIKPTHVVTLGGFVDPSVRDASHDHGATTPGLALETAQGMATTEETRRPAAAPVAIAEETREVRGCDLDGGVAHAAGHREPIWTDEQVAALNARQEMHDVHPMTCGNDSRHGGGKLLATNYGWACPDCDYKQTWSM